MNNIPEGKKEHIKRTIEQKVASLMAMIDDTTVVSNAQQLLDTEKSVAAITDEIAGCVIETVVARSVQNKATAFSGWKKTRKR